MKTSAILLLVPGGIGVQGVAAILKDDFSSGMSFVVDMMVVGLAITLGLLMAKLVVPNTMYGALKNGSQAHVLMVKQLEEEVEEEGEMRWRRGRRGLVALGWIRLRRGGVMVVVVWWLRRMVLLRIRSSPLMMMMMMMRTADWREVLLDDHHTEGCCAGLVAFAFIASKGLS